MKLVARTVSPAREPKKIAKQDPKASPGFGKMAVRTRGRCRPVLLQNSPIFVGKPQFAKAA
jgi:hypothetical protein